MRRKEQSWVRVPPAGNLHWRSARCPCGFPPFLESTEEKIKAVDELSWSLYSTHVFYQPLRWSPFANETMHLEGLIQCSYCPTDPTEAESSMRECWVRPPGAVIHTRSSSPTRSSPCGSGCCCPGRRSLFRRPWADSTARC